MYENIDDTLEKIYILQPITRENSEKHNTKTFKFLSDNNLLQYLK